MSTPNRHKKKVQWRLRPPGVAQKYLENLFSTGEIRKDMTPSVCYNKYDVFKAFSMEVLKKFMQQKTDLDVLMMIPKKIMNKVRIIINNIIIINNKYHKLT